MPPIVSEELWEKANNKLLSRSKSAKMYQKHQTKYSLSGKLYCEKHKCGFVRKVRHYKNKEDVVYWYCGDFHKTGRKDCCLCCLQEREVYNEILVSFQSCVKNKEIICSELLNLYSSFLKREKSIKQETELQDELKRLQIKKDKLLNLALEDIFSKEDLQQKELEIKEKIRQVEEKLKGIENKKIENGMTQKYNQILKENILKELEITEENLEIYIDELLDKIIVQENSINIIKNTKLSLPCTW